MELKSARRENDSLLFLGAFTLTLFLAGLLTAIQDIT